MISSVSRIFQPVPLAVGSQIVLDTSASHHLAHVLRAKIHDIVTVFNGSGGEFQGKIVQITKKNVSIALDYYSDREAESPLKLHLIQGISRGDKMDYTIQKAVELGVYSIIPVLSDKSSVKLDKTRQEKRIQHWQSIIIHACEQSGRNRLPTLFSPRSFLEALLTLKADYLLMLSPHHGGDLTRLSIHPTAEVTVLIGPEGGWTENEVMLARQHGSTPLTLGPRILRTETAAIAALTALQCIAGDMQ